MKIGDRVMIVPHRPMAGTCRVLVGQSGIILSGPFPHPTGELPGDAWELDLKPCNATARFAWWEKHLMPLDPDEKVKDEETADDHKKEPEAPHQGTKRRSALQPETT